MKNNKKAQVNTTSMSGKYPDVIKCGAAIFHIKSIDDANLQVSYRSLVGFMTHWVTFRNGTIHS